MSSRISVEKCTEVSKQVIPKGSGSHSFSIDTQRIKLREKYINHGTWNKKLTRHRILEHVAAIIFPFIISGLPFSVLNFYKKDIDGIMKAEVVVASEASVSRVFYTGKIVNS